MNGKQYGKATDISTAAKQAADLYEKIRERYNQRARTHLQQQILSITNETDRQVRAIIENGSPRSILLNDYVTKVSESVVKLKQMGNELGQPFLLFVVGAGKAGKSTLINALLGQKIAEMGKVPKTWKVDVYYGSRQQKEAEIRYRNGSDLFKPFHEVKMELESEEERRKLSEILVVKELEKLRAIGNNDTALLDEKKRELQKNHLYRSPVVEVRWPLPEKGFLEKFRLVDTPGLKQEGFFESIEENALEYYSKADGVIWILSADVLADKGPREEIEKVLAKFGNRTGNIIAVLNQIDKVRKNGGDGAVETVLKNAKETFGDLFSEIIPFSAQEALDGTLKNDQKLIETSGIVSLRDAIERRFVTRAQYVQVQSKTTGVAGIVGDILHMTDKNIKKLTTAEGERSTRQKNWETDVESLCKQSRKLREDSFSQQIEKIRRNAITHENVLWDLPNDRRNGFINEKILERESFEVAVDTLRKMRYLELDKITQVHKRASAFAEFPLLAAKGFLTRSGLEKQSLGSLRVVNESFNEDGAELMVGGGAALASCAVLGPLGLLAFFVIGTDFGKSIVKAVAKMFGNLPEKIVSQYREQLAEARRVLEKEETEWVAAAKKEVETVRENTFTDVFAPSGQVDAVLEKMQDIAKVANTAIAPLSIRDILTDGKH